MFCLFLRPSSIRLLCLLFVCSCVRFLALSLSLKKIPSCVTSPILIIMISFSTLIAPLSDVESCEINAAFLNLVMKDQFAGLPSEDAATHLNN